MVQNEGEDAFESYFELRVPQGLSYVKILRNDEKNIHVQCSAPSRDNNNTLRCDIGNPLPKGQMVTFDVVLQPYKMEGEMSPQYEFYMLVNSTNPENATSVSDNIIKVELPIWVRTELALQGSSQPIDIHYNTSQFHYEEITQESEIGPQVVHIYNIRNKGPSDFLEGEALFLWPSYTLSDEPLLYLLDQPETKGNIKCEFVEDVNVKDIKIDRKKFSYIDSEATIGVQSGLTAGSSSETSSGSSSSSSSGSSSSSSSSSSSTFSSSSSSSHRVTSGSSGNKKLTWEERKRLEEEARLRDLEEQEKETGDGSERHRTRYNIKNQGSQHFSSSGSKLESDSHSKAGYGGTSSSGGGKRVYEEERHNSSNTTWKSGEKPKTVISTSWKKNEDGEVTSGSETDVREGVLNLADIGLSNSANTQLFTWREESGTLDTKFKEIPAIHEERRAEWNRTKTFGTPSLGGIDRNAVGGTTFTKQWEKNYNTTYTSDGKPITRVSSTWTTNEDGVEKSGSSSNVYEGEAPLNELGRGREHIGGRHSTQGGGSTSVSREEHVSHHATSTAGGRRVTGGGGYFVEQEEEKDRSYGENTGQGNRRVSGGGETREYTSREYSSNSSSRGSSDRGSLGRDQITIRGQSTDDRGERYGGTISRSQSSSRTNEETDRERYGGTISRGQSSSRTNEETERERYGGTISRGQSSSRTNEETERERYGGTISRGQSSSRTNEETDRVRYRGNEGGRRTEDGETIHREHSSSSSGGRSQGGHINRRVEGEEDVRDHSISRGHSSTSVHTTVTEDEKLYRLDRVGADGSRHYVVDEETTSRDNDRSGYAGAHESSSRGREDHRGSSHHRTHTSTSADRESSRGTSSVNNRNQGGYFTSHTSKEDSSNIDINDLLRGSSSAVGVNSSSGSGGFDIGEVARGPKDGVARTYSVDVGTDQGSRSSGSRHSVHYSSDNDKRGKHYSSGSIDGRTSDGESGTYSHHSEQSSSHSVRGGGAREYGHGRVEASETRSKNEESGSRGGYGSAYNYESSGRYSPSGSSSRRTEQSGVDNVGEGFSSGFNIGDVARGPKDGVARTYTADLGIDQGERISGSRRGSHSSESSRGYSVSGSSGSIDVDRSRSGESGRNLDGGVEGGYSSRREYSRSYSSGTGAARSHDGLSANLEDGHSLAGGSGSSHQWSRSYSSTSGIADGDRAEHGGTYAGRSISSDRDRTFKHYVRERRDLPPLDDLNESLHCGPVKCSKIRCSLGSLKKDEEAIVAFRSRVWAPTIKKMSSNIEFLVSSQVVARVTKLPHIGRPLAETAPTYSHETISRILPSETPSKPDIIPLWIVVLSACAGALILMLVVYALYKCGFFKRNRPSNAPEKQPLNRNGHYNGDEAL